MYFTNFPRNVTWTHGEITIGSFSSTGRDEGSVAAIGTSVEVTRSHGPSSVVVAGQGINISTAIGTSEEVEVYVQRHGAVTSTEVIWWLHLFSAVFTEPTLDTSHFFVISGFDAL